MKIIKHYLMIILLIATLITVNVQNAFAASFNVSASNNKNGTATITVSGNVVGAFNVSVAGKSAKLSIRTIGGSDSTTITTGEGTFTVTVTAISISDADYNVIEGEKVTKSVTVTKPTSGNTGGNTNGSTGGNTGSNNGGSTGGNNGGTTTPDNRSKNNDLQSLTLSTGTLSPNFSASTTSYKVDLTSDVTKFNIDAKAKDSKAKVSGTGEKELKIGENNFVVTVVAENGTKKTYTISAYVTEKATQFVKFNDKDYGVLSDFSKTDLPKGYSPTTVKVDGKDVSALKSDVFGLTVLYLQDSTGKTGFYIYENDKVVGELQTVTINQKSYIVLNDKNIVKDLTGIKESTIKIGDLEFQGWLFDDKKMSNYSLVHLMNEKGEKGLYMYESSEGTLQKYVATTTSSSNNMMTYVFIGTTALFAITTVAAVVMYLNFKKKSISSIKDYYDSKNQGE